MPGATNGVADQLDPGGVNRRLAELEKQVRELRAARRLQSATIGAGGLVVTGKGGVYVEDDFGNFIFTIGGLSVPLTGGAAQYGVLLNRQNADGTTGAVALTMYSSSGAMPQTLGLYDAQGNNLWSDDGTAAQGMSRPYLSFPLAPANAAAWQSTNAGSWTTLFIAGPPKQHPKVSMSGFASTPSGVTGQLRLWDGVNSVQIGSTITVTSAPGGVNWTIGPAAVGGNHMDQMNLQLQGQITAGSGSIAAHVWAAYGRQS